MHYKHTQLQVRGFYRKSPQSGYRAPFDGGDFTCVWGCYRKDERPVLKATFMLLLKAGGNYFTTWKHTTSPKKHLNKHKPPLGALRLFLRYPFISGSNKKRRHSVYLGWPNIPSGLIRSPWAGPGMPQTARLFPYVNLNALEWWRTP